MRVVIIGSEIDGALKLGNRFGVAFALECPTCHVEMKRGQLALIALPCRANHVLHPKNVRETEVHPEALQPAGHSRRRLRFPLGVDRGELPGEIFLAACLGLTAKRGE